MKAIIGQYRQSDGWHAYGVFQSAQEGRQWREAIDESGGHHHARRTLRVSTNSAAYLAALEMDVARKADTK